MSAELRACMARVFDELGSDEGRDFARFLRGEDVAAPPCWGTIAERFDSAFPEDGARLELLEGILALGDRQTLLLFLDASRMRPRILEALVQSAARLAPAEQCALVAVIGTSETVSIPAGSRAALHPAARELVGASEHTRRREHELFAARVAALRAMRIRAARTALLPKGDGPSHID